MTDQDVSAQMAKIAREIQSEGDLTQAGDRIVELTAALFGDGAEAGISIAHRKHRVENGGASSEVARRGDELQTELKEGPCLDAVWEQEQVVTSDLAHDDRWPTWGPRMAKDHGINSMMCTQLFTNENQLGALNIYSPERDAFDEEDQETARLLAAHVAVAVAAAQEVQGLKFAVDRRTTIGTAIGIVMIRYDVDRDRAFTVLQRVSSHSNRKLFDLAQDVVRTRGLPSHDG